MSVRCPTCGQQMGWVTVLDATVSYGAIPFTHWSKDPLIPYPGCSCSSCQDARIALSINSTDGTAPQSNGGEGVT